MGQAVTQTKYLTKVVMFNGQKMTLFSLDGNTWSTRKLELAEIKIRHETQRAELAGKKEEPEVGAPALVAAKHSEDDLEPSEVVDYTDVPVKDSEEPFSISDVEEDEVKPSKNLKASKKLPIKPASAFIKNNKKADLKISGKKNLVAKTSPVKSKEKKADKPKLVKPVSKKTAKKQPKAKSRKAA